MKKTILIITLLITIFVSSCGIQTYEDTNGVDNYSLQTLTREDLITKKSSKTEYIIRNTNGLGEHYINCKSLNGVTSIDEFSDKDFVIKVDLTISKGNLSLALCTKDEIIYEFMVNEQSQEFHVISNQKVFLRVAGESASYILQYKIEE